jgi:hypothetical protein
MAPRFLDLAGITFLTILAVIPFVLLGAVQFTMVVFLTLAFATCIGCNWL